MRYGKTAAMVVLLLLSSSALAQRLPTPDPLLLVNGQTTAEVGKKCVISIATTAKKVTWKIPSGCDTQALDGKRLAVWALPGTYTFVAMVPNGEDVESIDYVLTVTGPRPPPGPGPDPEPKPPGTRSFWVVTVEDMTVRSIATATLLGDLPFWDSLKKSERGHDYRFYDKTAGNGITYAAKAAAKGVKLPAVLLFDKSATGPSEPVAVEALSNKAEIDELIRKNGGK